MLHSEFQPCPVYNMKPRLKQTKQIEINVQSKVLGRLRQGDYEFNQSGLHTKFSSQKENNNKSLVNTNQIRKKLFLFHCLTIYFKPGPSAVYTFNASTLNIKTDLYEFRASLIYLSSVVLGQSVLHNETLTLKILFPTV